MTLVVGVLLNLLNYFLLTENLDSDCRPPNIGSKFDFQGGVWEIFITFRTAKICEGATSGLKKRSSFDRNIKQNGSDSSRRCTYGSKRKVLKICSGRFL